MNHKRCKFFALLMSVILLVNIPVYSTFADDVFLSGYNNHITTSSIEEQGSQTSNALTSDAYSPPVSLSIPEVIRDSDLCKQFTSRRNDEERTLYDLVFENEDHTLTSFVFAAPIKYQLSPGETRDISTLLYESTDGTFQPVTEEPGQETLTSKQVFTILEELQANGFQPDRFAYAALDNASHSLFPSRLSDGIVLTNGQYSIRMIPDTEIGIDSKANADDKRSVSYPGVFDPTITIQYTPTMSGIKEEIILSTKPDTNEFSFVIEPGECMIQMSEDYKVTLTALETDIEIRAIDPVLIWDADGIMTEGSIGIQNSPTGLILTISVNPAFLSSAAYPVVIDSSMSFYNVEDGFSYFIQEAGLYSDAGAWGYSFESVHYVGMNPSVTNLSADVLDYDQERN